MTTPGSVSCVGLSWSLHYLHLSQWQGILALGVPVTTQSRGSLRGFRRRHTPLGKETRGQFLWVSGRWNHCALGGSPPTLACGVGDPSRSWEHSYPLQTPGTTRRLLCCEGFLNLYFL